MAEGRLLSRRDAKNALLAGTVIALAGLPIWFVWGVYAYLAVVWPVTLGWVIRYQREENE